jgi:hypothetical protein
MIVFISFLGESAGAGLFSETTGGGEAGFAAYRLGVRAGGERLEPEQLRISSINAAIVRRT